MAVGWPCDVCGSGIGNNSIRYTGCFAFSALTPLDRRQEEHPAIQCLTLLLHAAILYLRSCFGDLVQPEITIIKGPFKEKTKESSGKRSSDSSFQYFCVLL